MEFLDIILITTKIIPDSQLFLVLLQMKLFFCIYIPFLTNLTIVINLIKKKL